MGTIHSVCEAVNDRVTNIQDDQDDNCPIKGLSKTPLVSLDEATKDLVAIIPDIKQYVAFTRSHLANSDFVLPKNVTMEGMAAIVIYTIEWKADRKKSLYWLLNESLRQENRSSLKPFFPYLKLLLTTLYLLPAYSGHVWRGIRKNMAKDYTKGKVFSWWAFSSCTFDMETMNDDKYLGQVGERTLFKIHCTNGREIWQWSAVTKEKEIVLPPGTTFEVKGVLDMGGGVNIIELEEIQPKIQMLENDILHPQVMKGKVTKLPGKGEMYTDIVKGLKESDVDVKTVEMYISAIPTAIKGCDKKANHTELIELVIKRLHDNNDVGVADAALLALDSLATTEKHMFVIKNSGGLDEIIKCMNKFYAYEYVLTQGFYIISRFLSENNETLKSYVMDEISGPAGLDVLAKTLECHQKEETLIQYVCGLISSIGVRDQSLYKSFVQRSILTLLIDVLRATNVTTALSSLRAIRNASVSEVSRSSIASSNGINRISSAMKKHVVDETFQSVGCESLRNLSSNDDIAQNVGKSGALNVVIQSMDAHTDNKDVQSNGCSALYNFARIQGNRKDVVMGLQCIVRAMSTHEHVADVLENACRALAMICASPETTDLVLSKTLDLIVAAMANHAQHEGVLKNACFALTNMATNDANKNKISAKPQAFTSALTALDMFLKSNSDLVKFAFAVVVKLALTNEGQKMLGSDEGITTMLNVVKESSSSDMVRDICLLLASLCRDTAAKQRIVDANSVKILKGALNRVNDDTRIVIEKVLLKLQPK